MGAVEAPRFGGASPSLRSLQREKRNVLIASYSILVLRHEDIKFALCRVLHKAPPAKSVDR